MNFTFNNKGLDRTLWRSLAVSCLLAGSVSLGALGCGGNSTGMTPTTTTMPPGTGPTPTTVPTPYTPAYPPAPPQVQRGTGGILTAPHVIPVFFNGDKMQSQLYTFIQNYITRSISWQVMKEYGIGFGTVAPVTVLQQSLPAAMTDKDVQTFLGARVQDGSLVPDAQSVVVMYFPASVTISNNGEMSCKDFAGYHGDATLPSGTHLAYAVIPRCNQSATQPEPLSSLTFATSHELAEAATDPTIVSYNDLNDPYTLWQLNLGGSEVGDLCQNLADTAVNETGIGIIARVWSNTAMAAYNNPCQPAAPGPAFFSIPMHTQLQTVQLNTA